jgi:alpha-galactosidase
MHLHLSTVSANRLLCVLLFSLLLTQLSAQWKDCHASLDNDTLVLENSLLQRRMLWRNGGLAHIDLLNKSTGKKITSSSVSPVSDLNIPGLTGAFEKGEFNSYTVAATNATPGYLAAEVITHKAGLIVKRVFRIYPDCPAIACDIYLRGKASGWVSSSMETMDLKNIEDQQSRRDAKGKFFITDKVGISGNHWKLKAVEFFDATDYNNTLVQEQEVLVYRQESKLRGNILLAENKLLAEGFFILKESPVSTIQLHYEGFDFAHKFGEIYTTGIGISPQDLSDSEWVKGYSIVLGVGKKNGEQSLLEGLRLYQSIQRTFIHSRDDMVLSNTWGDRSQDKRVNETFILQEIEAAAKLGITHLQIDDGWQLGKSSNSATGGSLVQIWRNPDYWKPDPKKFPGGLQKIIAAASEKHITVSLWFNPSTDSSFTNWEKDADLLISTYKEYGITMWKIDGVNIPDKKAETNFRKFLDKVTAATDYQAVFNLDVTAGKRFGYHSFYQYGNLFLENRYTDWTNYYPYTTLRNLWQLSRYMPVQRLQIEFLNKWRNVSKYPVGDSLAPSFYSFDYLFAITMMAQPLAWFEVSSLPAEAFRLSGLIKQYKSISTNLHAGQIFPIGDEPDGFSWTGFQSLQRNTGYFLVFRENTLSMVRNLKVNLPAGTKLNLQTVTGESKSFNAVVGANGTLAFQLPNKNSFQLVSYTIN